MLQRQQIQAEDGAMATAAAAAAAVATEVLMQSRMEFWELFQILKTASAS